MIYSNLSLDRWREKRLRDREREREKDTARTVDQKRAKMFRVFSRFACLFVCTLLFFRPLALSFTNETRRYARWHFSRTNSHWVAESFERRRSSSHKTNAALCDDEENTSKPTTTRQQSVDGFFIFGKKCKPGHRKARVGGLRRPEVLRGDHPQRHGVFRRSSRTRRRNSRANFEHAR